MNPSVYEFHSYKAFLRETIRSAEKRGMVGLMASAAGCNRTYLSQALSTKVQLTPDHIIGIAGFLGLDPQSQEYLLYLLLYERSNSDSARKVLAKKIQDVSGSALKVSQMLKKGKEVVELPDVRKARYYSSWIFSAVHVLTSIKKFETAKSISEHLQISIKIVEQVLQELVEMQLVLVKDQKFSHSGRPIHVPAASLFYMLHHRNWRQQANLIAENSEAVSYTDVFSISASDWPAFKSKLLDFIEKHRQRVTSSGSEDVFCFCADLFKVSTT